jgi:hypothetical protein
MKSIFRNLLFLGVIGVSIFALFFVVSSVWIGFDVKKQCRDAKNEYGQEKCVDALITLLNDEDRGFSARNSAIWALGQLGDDKALPVLQHYYTGIIPDKEPLNGVISQYELKKAVNLTSGGKNITSIFWRYRIDD